MNNFNRYIPIKSAIHNLNPNIKYLMQIIVIFAIPFLNYANYLLLFILLTILIFLSKIPFFYFQKKLIFVYIIAIIAALLSFIYPSINLEYAFILLIRLYLIFGYVFIVIMTTKMIELFKLFSKLFNLLLNDENAKQCSFIVLLVINFINLLGHEIAHINLSLKTRGISISKGKIKTRYHAIVIFIRALINKIEDLIDEYELVLHGRNIDFNNIKHLKLKQKVKLIDILLIVIIITIILI